MGQSCLTFSLESEFDKHIDFDKPVDNFDPLPIVLDFFKNQLDLGLQA